jgi:hypothetical protein
VPIATGRSSLGAATDDIPTQATSGTVTQTNDDGVRSLTLSYGWWVSLGVPGQASASVLRIFRTNIGVSVQRTVRETTNHAPSSARH